MSKSKIALIIFVTLLVTLGLGWAWGASGRWDAQRSLTATEQKLDLSNGLATVLRARVSLYNVNFGDASRALEEAKVPLERAQKRFEDRGDTEAAKNLSAALTNVKQAQVLAGKLDQTANKLAADAVSAIEAAAVSAR